METQDFEYVYNNSSYDYYLYNLSDLSNLSNLSNAKERHIGLPIILSIVILLSLIGNILVVVISVLDMRLRSLTIIFILNLALSDLLSTFRLVFKVCEHIWGLNLGDAGCKAVHLVSSIGYYSSIVFLVLMSIQRYTVVVHPPSGWRKGPCITHVLVCAWVVSILAAFPVMAQVVARPDSGHCTYSSSTAFLAIAYKENIVFVCAFLFMAFCYIRILQTIFKSPTNQRHRTTALAFFLVATFFICWAPYNIVNFLLVLHYQIAVFYYPVLEHLNYASYICDLLAYIRCCLNPVIYGLFGVKFRKAAREIFHRQAPLNSAETGIEERHSDSLGSI